MTQFHTNSTPLTAILLAGLLALAGAAGESSAAAITLPNVPAYNWYHGCGPTAAGSIVGYYDMLGYSNLFDADGWDDIKLTSNVQDQISSPAHNAKYDPHPDDPSLPVPENTSIACWFQTSVNQQYGWSWVSRSDNAFEGFADYRGYVCDSYYKPYGSQSYQFDWNDLVAEIDAGRPLMFLVDTDANGATDHFVPVFGYDDRGGGDLYYGSYSAWSEPESIAWRRMRPMGNPWGIGYATFVDIWARAGDFNTDGFINGEDIDLLADSIRLSLGYDAAYDFTGPGEDGVPDGVVTLDDLNFLIHQLVETTIGTGTEYGDFNLDGLVNTTDLTRLATDYGLGDTWDKGNANRNIDLVTDTTDLTILATSYGFGEPDIVPEPASAGLLLLGASTILRRRRKT